jgi:hypothetical protein
MYTCVLHAPPVLFTLVWSTQYKLRSTADEPRVGAASFTAVTMTLTVVWDATACSVVGVCRRFGGTFYLFSGLIYQITWRYIPEDMHLYNIRYCVVFTFLSLRPLNPCVFFSTMLWRPKSTFCLPFTAVFIVRKSQFLLHRVLGAVGDIPKMLRTECKPALCCVILAVSPFRTGNFSTTLAERVSRSSGESSFLMLLFLQPFCHDGRVCLYYQKLPLSSARK